MSADMYDGKALLRRKLKALRAGFELERVQTSSMLVAEHILACDAYQKAGCVMGYLAFGNELSVDAVLRQALSDGKQVLVPFITGDTSFEAAPLHGMDAFELDRYGIRSVPRPEKFAVPEVVDLVLVPGVAFGCDGSRLGMGAGYYDRFLPRTGNAVTIGVAYEALLQPELPCDEYDVRMRYIVSERGLREAEAYTDIKK